VPSNQIDVSIHIESPQADIQALQKLTEALKTIPGAQGGGGGRIQQTFATQGEAGSFLNKQAAGAEAIGQKLTGAKVKASEGGGFEASADVSPEQKKAFNPGGAIAAMATGVGVTVGIFKQLLGMSKIFQTFMGTTGKILATAVDLMLAPLMPFFMRIMIWLIQTIFPLATKVGNWLGGLGDVGLGAALVGGFVALKFGPKLLVEAGKSLGNALVNHMPYDTMGKNISAGLTLAKKTLISWGETVGGYISSGLKAAAKLAKTAWEALGTFISDGLKAAAKLAKVAWEAVGGFISSGLDAAAKLAKSAWEAVGGFISKGLDAAAKLAEAAWKAVGGFISAGASAAANLATTAWEAVGGFISKGASAAAALATTAWEAVGGFISKGLSAAANLAKAAWEAVGGFISDGLKAAANLAKAAWEAVGGFISDGLSAAADLAVDAWKAVGGFISKGLSAAADLAVDSWKAVGGFISAGLESAVALTKTAWEALGGFISSGLIAAKGAMKTVMESVGTALSGAATGAMRAASAVWTAIGGAIGAAIAASKKAFTVAGEAIGSAISVAMKGAKNLWSGLGSVGGLIGIGIGAAAIGATIGYMMWKEYDKYQQGKDITKGLSQLEQVRMLQQNYGISEQQAVTIQEGMAAGGVSVSRQGMDDYMKLSQDLADQVRLFGNYDAASLAAMERKEQLLFADMMEGGMFGDKETFQGMIEMIRAGQTSKGVSIGSAEETLAQSQLMTQKERKAAAEAEIEAQAWYAMSIGGQHINLLDMAVKSLLPMGGIVGGGWLSSKLGFGTASGNVKEDEKKVREALGELYGGGVFKGEMTGEQANLGAWFSAVRGDAASSFFSKDVASDLLGGQYQDEEIKRMAGSVINIMLNTDSLEFLSDEQRSRLLAMLPKVLESGVVSPSL